MAGCFKVRVRVTLDDDDCVSEEEDLKVRFPSYGRIVSDGAVQNHTAQAWQNTLNATTETTRREEGFWIRINTSENQEGDEFTVTIEGPVVGNEEGATIGLGPRPEDTEESPSPNSSATYAVASFHTHTPTTYRDVGRPAGPSGPDHASDLADDVAGVVYGYVEDPASSGEIPAGHPIDSPAQRYHLGPERRSTPCEE